MSTLVCYAHPALILVTFRNRDRKASPLLVTNIAQAVYQNELYLHEKIPGRKLLMLCPVAKTLQGKVPIVSGFIEWIWCLQQSGNGMGSVFTGQLSSLSPEFHISTNMKQTRVFYLSPSTKFIVFMHCDDLLLSKGFLESHCKGLRHISISEV